MVVAVLVPCADAFASAGFACAPSPGHASAATARRFNIDTPIGTLQHERDFTSHAPWAGGYNGRFRCVAV